MKLKPCPWCGSEDVKVIYDPVFEAYYVDCNRYNCSRVKVVGYATKEQCIKAWNDERFRKGFERIKE